MHGQGDLDISGPGVYVSIVVDLREEETRRYPLANFDGKGTPFYEEFEATSLYCPHCKEAVPVRKKLLLILPEGDEYEYLCARCGSSVGMKLEKGKEQIKILV